MMPGSKHHSGAKPSNLLQGPQLLILRYPIPLNPQIHIKNAPDLAKNRGRGELPDEGVPEAGGGIGIGEGCEEALATAVEDERIALGRELLANVAVHRGVDG